MDLPGVGLLPDTEEPTASDVQAVGQWAASQCGVRAEGDSAQLVARLYAAMAACSQPECSSEGMAAVVCGLEGLLGVSLEHLSSRALAAGTTSALFDCLQLIGALAACRGPGGATGRAHAAAGLKAAQPPLHTQSAPALAANRHAPTPAPPDPNPVRRIRALLRTHRSTSMRLQRYRATLLGQPVHPPRHTRGDGEGAADDVVPAETVTPQGQHVMSEMRRQLEAEVRQLQQELYGPT